MTDGLGLEGAYSETLSRIKGQGEEEARLGMATLMWISHSERPLKIDELCHALGVEIGSPDLDGDNVPSVGTLLSSCQGLVTVDKEASTVRLIHFTLLEYLRAHPELFGRAHSTIAETCLSYLNSNQVTALSTTPPYPDTPFLEYSSLYWGVHAKRDLSDCARLLVLKLFDNYNNHISPKVLLNAQKPRFSYVNFDKPSRFSGLHCASFFGIVEVVTGFVEMKDCDINQTDSIDFTPLTWASRNGHGGVVKILLGRDDVNPDKQDKYGRTPLWAATENGHEGVVEMLLARDDVNPEKPDKYGQTPLCSAASNGHEGVVKILLRRDNVNPDKPGEYKKTPLCCASWNGHEGVVKILLRRDDVNTNHPDNCRQTPLCGAVTNGHEGVVKILLEQDDVDPNSQDMDGETPLWRAARFGYERVVKILLERGDVDPDKPDKHGRTPLSCATEYGHTAVIALLQLVTSATPSTE